MEKYVGNDILKQEDDEEAHSYLSADDARRGQHERYLRRISEKPNEILVKDRRMAFVCPHKFFDDVKINCALRDLEAGHAQEQTTLIVEGEVNKALDHEFGF